MNITEKGRDLTQSYDKNVKYKRTDAPPPWHQQQSTTVDIHGPLQTRGETRCPGGVPIKAPTPTEKSKKASWEHKKTPPKIRLHNVCGPTYYG